MPEHDENLWNMPITNIPVAQQSHYSTPIPEHDENITSITNTLVSIMPITNTNLLQVDDVDVEMELIEIDNESLS